MPRLSKYTVGSKIDALFTDTIEATFLAAYTGREQKLGLIMKASAKLDAVKFFLTVAWEMKVLDHKKYSLICQPLSDIGKMFGGWLKDMDKRTPR